MCRELNLPAIDKHGNGVHPSGYLLSKQLMPQDGQPSIQLCSLCLVCCVMLGNISIECSKIAQSCIPLQLLQHADEELSRQHQLLCQNLKQVS